MRAPLCAGFVYGAANTNACPPGYSKMVFAAACPTAAGVLGRTYYGSGTYTDRPSGCYYYNDFVRFNEHPTGAPNPSCTPVCAGKPLTATPLTADR